MQVQSKHGRESNLNFRTFENLVRRRAVKERDEKNKRKGNSCPWRGFCETDKGRKWSEDRAEREKQRGGQERKGYRCSRRDYPIYCYLLFYQSTVAEGTGRNNFYEYALVCCCWWFQGSSLSFYRGPANRSREHDGGMQADKSHLWRVLDRDEAQQLSSLTDIFIIAAPLRELLMCISSDNSLSGKITVKFQWTIAVALEEMLN